MGFYYISIFSIVPLGIAYGVLALVYWGVVRATRGTRARRAILPIVGAVFLVLPISEELWIAWNFGQACKEAGTFIHKKVQVDGFYDDTTHWWRQLAESKYQFVESRDNLYGTLWRVERAGDEIKHFKIDRPTARYHYTKPHSHTRVAHKTTMFEYLVRDTQANEILAREKTYAREAPWYFISLDRPTLFCPVSGKYGERIHATIYDIVLQPSERR